MNKIYTKEIITTTKISNFIKCDKCDTEICIDWNCCDIPPIIEVNEESYCINCQNKYKVGWFKPKIEK